MSVGLTIIPCPFTDSLRFSVSVKVFRKTAVNKMQPFYVCNATHDSIPDPRNIMIKFDKKLFYLHSYKNIIQL